MTGLMRQWQEQLARGMRALQANGLVSSDLDVDRTAAALLAGIQGGVTIMMSTGDSSHLKAALDTGIEHLRCSPTMASGPVLSRDREQHDPFSRHP
ncbi:TetR family transcriptional regulator C-terminal domain-containing protein [Streptomyces sp. 4N124]|uniref:TetR family transcriptional regulator C-terminal domain-containing protein n=1 Tax=Streptomyces sp. 4N124 TaxID=3457420 RepID=UPI003FCF63D9